MKKLLLVFTVFIIVLSSCKKSVEIKSDTPNADTSSVDTQPIYFYFAGQRFNAQTGEATFLCADPLCSHDGEDCPLYGFDRMAFYTVINNNIYFIADTTTKSKDGFAFIHEIKIKKYDISTNHVSVLYNFNLKDQEYEFSGYNFYVQNDKIYIPHSYISAGDKNNIKKYILQIDAETDKPSIIYGYTDDSQAENYFCGISDDKIFWRCSDNKYYSTDMNGENKTEIDPMEHSEIPLFKDWKDSKTIRGLYNQDSVNIKAFDISKWSVFCGSDKYFVSWDQSMWATAGVSAADGTEVTNQTGGKLWRARGDGGGIELVYDFGDLLIFNLATLMVSGTSNKINGDYIMVGCTQYKVVEDNADKTKKVITPALSAGMKGQLLIFNVKTLDYHIVEY